MARWTGTMSSLAIVGVVGIAVMALRLMPKRSASTPPPQPEPATETSPANDPIEAPAIPDPEPIVVGGQLGCGACGRGLRTWQPPIFIPFGI